MKHTAALAAALAGLFSLNVSAEDFHPLASMDLTGGIYDYDNVILPAGVTVNFVGEPKEMTLRADQDILLDGSLIGPGWALILEAGGTIQLGGAAMLDIGNGSMTLISGGNIAITPYVPVDMTTTTYGGLIITNDPPGGNLTVITSAVPEPDTWAVLLAGLGLTALLARRTRR